MVLKCEFSDFSDLCNIQSPDAHRHDIIIQNVWTQTDTINMISPPFIYALDAKQYILLMRLIKLFSINFKEN